MDTFFTVSNFDLAKLDATIAVTMFRDLLWAEVRTLGIPVNRVNISSWINVPDGGVDASVEAGLELSRTGLIKPRYTAYQIKTGTSFEPWQAAEIHKELFGKAKVQNQQNLAARVKDCMDRGGTYVVVCFGQDPTGSQRAKAEENIRTALTACEYRDPEVEVWGQNNLISFIQVFPSLSLRVNGHNHGVFQTHKSWSQQQDMRTSLKSAEDQDQVTKGIRELLRKNDESVHARVLGEPGIGKTRLVLEATNAEDIAPLVLYCNAARFKDSGLMDEILRDDNIYSVVLVLDECNVDDRAYIWNKLEYCGPRIKLISIYNDYDSSSGKTVYFELPALAAQQISAIIQDYKIPKYQADRWSELCSGSPRVAHVIGGNLVRNPQDLLKSPDTINVWERYVVGPDDPKSEDVRQRELVLQHLALFKRFGYERAVTGDAQIIARRIQEAAPQITWPRFQQIIKSLRHRKLLQGEYTLYISPKAFHIKLWVDWWETYGHTFNLTMFSRGLPPKLLEWFYEMFVYARESKAASRVVKELLGENGPFHDADDLNSELRARFFWNLAEADPEGGLRCLQRTIGTVDVDQLKEFRAGRRSIVWALEGLVIWKELFQDSARLLLLLAEAENESWGNNATGIFVRIFANARGAVASTEATPEERFPILKEALSSDSKARRMLAIKACNAGLETQNFSRPVGAEYQGLRSEPHFWQPKSYAEIHEAYSRVWNLLTEKLDGLAEDERAEAITVLLNKASSIGRIAPLTETVIATLEQLLRKSYITTQQLQKVVARFLMRKGAGKSPETQERWKKLRDDLEPRDFHATMQRYVALDLIEDKFDENANYVDQAVAKIESLAQEAVASPDILWPELTWLMTTEAQRGLEFGFALGTYDKEFSLLPALLEVQRKAEGTNVSAFFLSGYFRALRQASKQEWEHTLDRLRSDDKLKLLIPELTWRSGITNQSALRVLDLAKNGEIQPAYFQIFCYGLELQNLSESVFQQWIEYLLSIDDAFIANITTHLFHTYYIRKKDGPQISQDLTLRVLTQPALFKPHGANQMDQMNDYYWANIASRYVGNYPENSITLASTIVEHFGEEGTILGGFPSSSQKVLGEITKIHPNQVWDLVKIHLGFPIDSRAFHIKEWLRGGSLSLGDPIDEGELARISPDRIWEWVDEDVENRAWYLATFVPPMLTAEKGKTPLARELLVRYGERDDVRRNLQANFGTEGWVGNASDHFREKKQHLQELSANEHHPNVLRWLNEYIENLDNEIEHFRTREEREF